MEDAILGLIIIAITIIIVYNKKKKKKQSEIEKKRLEEKQQIAEENSYIFDNTKIQNTKENKNNINQTENNLIPYRKKYLLTKNELYFYKKLKNVSDIYGYVILSKVRLADIVEVNNEINDYEHIKYFNKIAAKHIDFILCNKENLKIELLIELDDNSHKDIKRIERDNFIKEICNKVGYKIIRTYDASTVEKYLQQKNNTYTSD